jgi:hypothetical protein
VATDRLKIYNGALLLCGERQLATLSENREPRFLLDLVWNDGGVRYCLEQAQWHFAMRSSRFDYDPSIVPEWGFNRAFTKPDDWVSTSGVFQDEFMKTPLTDYADEQGTGSPTWTRSTCATCPTTPLRHGLRALAGDLHRVREGLLREPHHPPLPGGEGRSNG